MTKATNEVRVVLRNECGLSLLFQPCTFSLIQDGARKNIQRSLAKNAVFGGGYTSHQGVLWFWTLAHLRMWDHRCMLGKKERNCDRMIICNNNCRFETTGVNGFGTAVIIRTVGKFTTSVPLLHYWFR